MTQHFQTISNYRLVEELAEGVFGRAYRAEHMYLTNRVAAIKLLHALVKTEKERKNFLHEARILELLKHPHILSIIDFGIQEGTPYLITAFASGGSLRDRLNQVDTQQLSLDEILRILHQTTQALHAAHQQQVAHGDLKPENILFDINGNALLADFGISTILGNTDIRTTDSIGTPSYMAPEQFQGHATKAGCCRQTGNRSGYGESMGTGYTATKCLFPYQALCPLWKKRGRIGVVRGRE